MTNRTQKSTTTLLPVLHVNAYEVQHMTVEQFFEMLLNSPFFQRAKSWKSDGNEQLYVTMSLAEPMPSFVVGRTDDGKLWLIDGQQRTNALFEIMKTVASIPSALAKVKNYVLTVQFVDGTLEELQSLFVRINKNSGLTQGAKIAGSLKGSIGEIKNSIRNNPSLIKAFERTTKGKIGELSFEKIQSGNIIEASLFLTSCEAFGFAGLSTKSLECETKLNATGITLPQATQFYIERATRRIETLCMFLENISVRKNVKGNLAFLSCVYLLSDTFTVRQLIDGFNSMFGTDNKGIDKKRDIVVNGIMMNRTYKELFGSGSTNTNAKTLEKYAYIEQAIKEYVDSLINPVVTDIKDGDALALMAIKGQKTV
jgi:hypothetical protein